MRTILVAMLLSSITSALYATSQIPEALIYNGITNDMYSTPLESFFSAGKPKLFLEKPSSTACWRGYVGTWKIEDDELYLVVLQEGHPRTGAIPLDMVNPKWVSPVKATWFTGTIRIGSGKVLMGGMGISVKRESDIFLEITDGKVMSTRQVDNKEQKTEAEPSGSPYRR
jgi:hypothetical protein